MPRVGKKSEADRPGEIMADLWRLVLSVMDEAQDDLEGLGLAPKSFFVLASVDEHPFPAELARNLHLPPPTATYLIKQLEEKGLLERHGEPGDLRKFRLVRTRAGDEVLRRGSASLSSVLVDRLKRIDAGERKTFARILHRLAERQD